MGSGVGGRVVKQGRSWELDLDCNGSMRGVPEGLC